MFVTTAENLAYYINKLKSRPTLQHNTLLPLPHSFLSTWLVVISHRLINFSSKA